MAMKSEQKKALDRTLEVLAEDLDVTSAIIHLKSKGILEDIDEEKISAKDTEKEEVMEFVKIIKKRGERAFQILRNYLENSSAKHLATELDKNLKTTEAELAGLTMENDGRKQIEKWKELEAKFHLSRCQHESIGLYRNIPHKVNVLLIGKTGSGKSATGNTIIGKDHFKASGISRSVTKTIDMKVFEEGRFNITVIDTPGLFDTAKDFRNEHMLLEIAKTMINFNGGIHLFLLVCSSTRFTPEEQETVAVIEKILTKDVYKNCVVVLTYARAHYGAKSKWSLQEHIDDEVQQGGNFAALIQRVNMRVLAVENCFEDDFLREKHRQTFLCFLAQVIQGNNGSVYSNKAFENARGRVEKQDELRKQRIQKEKQLTIMRSQVRKFVVREYLNGLTAKQLLNIHGHFKTESLVIMKGSGADRLQCITNDDVKEYLEYFIRENEVLISHLQGMKQQEEQQRREYQNEQQQLKKMEALNKMHYIVLCSVRNNLANLSKEEKEEIIRRRVLPDEVMNNVKKNLSSSDVTFENRDILGYIEETFFQKSAEIKSNMADKILAEPFTTWSCLAEKQSNQLKQLQRHQKINVIMETVNTKLPKALDSKTDDELNKLIPDLEYADTGSTEQWTKLFNNLIGDDVADSDITLGEISNLYLKQNAKLLQSIISTILERRQKQKEAKDREEMETLRNSALSRISEVIHKKLKLYLTLQGITDLQYMDLCISRGTVPDDIFSKVKGHLTRAQKQSLTDEEIKKEIIRQIKSQQEIIDKCKKDAQWCFSGSSEVIIKGRGISKISNVKVDDEILVFDEEGVCFFDKVYLISHARDEESINFIRLKTLSGKELYISLGHLIPVGSFCRNVAAKDVAVGDVIFSLQNGIMTSDPVTSISYELCRGAYCPMTMTGKIVVNDVAASCYTTFISPRVAHVLLSPIRLLFNYLPLPLFDKLLPYDDVEGMPVLLLKCRSSVTAWRSWVGSFNV